MQSLAYYQGFIALLLYLGHPVSLYYLGNTLGYSQGHRPRGPSKSQIHTWPQWSLSLTPLISKERGTRPGLQTSSKQVPGVRETEYKRARGDGFVSENPSLKGLPATEFLRPVLLTPCWSMSSEMLVLPFLDFQGKVKFFLSQKHIQNISNMIWVEGNTSKAKPSLK